MPIVIEDTANMSARAKTKVGTRICTEFVGKLKESQFYTIDFLPRFSECLEELVTSNRKISQIVCYGLGSFYHGVSVAPRYQLALLLVMHDKIKEYGSENLSDVIDIYDPRFKDRDLAILKSFEWPKFRVLEQNELCARKLEVTTLFFMPHLHKHLYHNLVGANWQPNQLKKLVVVGNSFQEMIDNTPVSKAKRELHYIDLLVNDFQVTNHKPLLHMADQHTSDDDIENQRHRALIEVSVDTDDDELRFSFSQQSVHFINDQWLIDNKDKIRDFRLRDWMPINRFPDD